jgi:hypothetical protein
LNRKIQIRRSKQGRGGAHRGKLVGEVLRYWIFTSRCFRWSSAAMEYLDDVREIAAISKT